jgi:hypothetical protein
LECDECRDGVGDVVPVLPGVDRPPPRAGPGRMGLGTELEAVLTLTVDDGRGLVREDDVREPAVDNGRLVSAPGPCEPGVRLERTGVPVALMLARWKTPSIWSLTVF